MRMISVTCFALGIATFSSAQQVSPARQIIQGVIESLNAANLNTFQISGTFESSSGSENESGSFSAVCNISGAAQLEMMFPSGTRTESRQTGSGVATGSWRDEQGKAHPMAKHNVQTPASWFCPQIALKELLRAPNLAIRFVGTETKNGSATFHYSVVSSTSSWTSELSASRDLAQTEVYLDATTFYPVAFAFNTHPDNNAMANIPVEIRFGAYATSGGVLMPRTIERYVSGSRLLTLQITNSAAGPSVVTTN